MDRRNEEIALKLRDLLDKINQCQKLVKKAYLAIPTHKNAMKKEFSRVEAIAIRDVFDQLDLKGNGFK